MKKLSLLLLFFTLGVRCSFLFAQDVISPVLGFSFSGYHEQYELQQPAGDPAVDVSNTTYRYALTYDISFPRNWFVEGGLSFGKTSYGSSFSRVNDTVPGALPAGNYSAKRFTLLLRFGWQLAMFNQKLLLKAYAGVEPGLLRRQEKLPANWEYSDAELTAHSSQFGFAMDERFTEKNKISLLATGGVRLEYNFYKWMGVNAGVEYSKGCWNYLERETKYSYYGSTPSVAVSDWNGSNFRFLAGIHIFCRPQ